jgi:hypothetical protein
MNKLQFKDYIINKYSKDKDSANVEDKIDILCDIVDDRIAIIDIMIDMNVACSYDEVINEFHKELNTLLE